jgi:Mrp family chromosome partitioning ATPase
MRAVGIESVRPEPTVFGAVRRYWVMVLAVALAGLVAAAAYSLAQTKIYRAYASVTVPVPVLLQGQQADPAQYLDSQVLLLYSQGVAQRAAVIANGELGGHVLTAGDFIGAGSKLVITPPVTATPGGYGASVIALWFGWPDARVAQLGADAVLQAFDQARSAGIAAQADATVAGINQTLAQTSDKQQQQALLGERAQVVTNEQVNLASHAALGWAVQPTAPLNGGLKRTAAMGLVIGLVVGAALAYGRASRRPGFANRKDPAALYGLPLLGEIPAFEPGNKALSNGNVAGALLPVRTDPRSAAAEAFRFAAGSIERVGAARGMRLSLVFVSPRADGDKSIVVANLAFALAEGGTRVLVVDADVADGGLAARLLRGTRAVGGLEEVLDGRLALADCVQPSPFNAAIGVLGCGPGPSLVTGATRAKAASTLLVQAKASFDLVLIDSPALQAADAAELVSACDAAITVTSPDELVRDHDEVADRLNLIETEVIGYIYIHNHESAQALLSRFRRSSSPAQPEGPPVTPEPATTADVRVLNGESHPQPDLPTTAQEASPVQAQGPSQPSEEG